MTQKNGKVVTYEVSQLVSCAFGNKLKLTKTTTGTGIMIFSKYQEGFFDFFVKNYKGSIIFVGKAAVNFSYEHGSSPRNSIVIFSDEPGHETYALSEVPNPWA